MLFRLHRRRSLLHTTGWIAATTSFPQSAAYPFRNPTPRVHPPPKGRSLAGAPSHSSGDRRSTADTSELRLQKLLRIKKIRLLRTIFEAFNIPDSKLATILRKFPLLLSYDLEKTIKPKLEFLHSSGFQGPVLANIVASNPTILRFDLNNNIIPFVSFLKEIIPNRFSTLGYLVLKTYPQGNLRLSNCLANVEVLKKHHISNRAILRIMLVKESVFGVSPRRLDRIVGVMKGVGFNQNSMMFAYAVRIFCSFKDKVVAQKIELYQSLGWKDEDVFRVICKHPNVIVLSDEVIKKKVAFFTEVLHWDTSVISRNPSLMSLSIEKRIKARAAVLNLLMLKGQISWNTRCYRFMHGEKMFHDRYVKRYKNKVLGVVEAYEGRVFEGWQQGCPEKVWVKF